MGWRDDLWVVRGRGRGRRVRIKTQEEEKRSERKKRGISNVKKEEKRDEF